MRRVIIAALFVLAVWALGSGSESTAPPAQQPVQYVSKRPAEPSIAERMVEENLKAKHLQEQMNEQMIEQHKSLISAVKAQITAREDLVRLLEADGQKAQANATRLEIKELQAKIKRIEQEPPELFK